MKGEMIYNIINGFWDLNAVSIPENMDLTDEFAEGTECCKLIDKVYQAKKNICEKLREDENVDIEIIFDGMEEIMRIISLKMYEYGKVESTYKHVG